MPRVAEWKTTGQKFCNGCRITLPVAEFHPKRRDSAGDICLYEPRCKSCSNERNRVQYSNHKVRRRASSLARYHCDPEKALDRSLRSKYGITYIEYKMMYTQQNGECLICCTSKPDTGKDRLVVDHDHVTGNVRGLLCHKCNRGIGFLNDNPTIVRSALVYLERC